MSKSSKPPEPMGKDQSQLAALFDANPTGLVLIDSKTRIIQQINAAAEVAPTQLSKTISDKLQTIPAIQFFPPAQGSAC